MPPKEPYRKVHVLIELDMYEKDIQRQEMHWEVATGLCCIAEKLNGVMPPTGENGCRGDMNYFDHSGRDIHFTVQVTSEVLYNHDD